MKKTLLFTTALFLGTLTLQANSSGEEIFKAKCAACHMLQPPGAMGQAGTSEFKKVMDELKAPPMAKVSQMVKMQYKDKAAYVKFVSEYISKPDASKSVCMKKAIEGFGLMPAMGAGMTDDEKKIVSEWIYDNVQTSKKIRMMKCGDGKCGGGMMKKAAKRQSSMKCAPGKCGGK